MRIKKGKFFFLGIALLLGVFLWVSFPAPVQQLAVPLKEWGHSFTEARFYIPQWCWTGRSVKLRVVLRQDGGEKHVVRARMETSPEVSGGGEFSQVVQGGNSVQFSWQLTSMTQGRKTWRIWLWSDEPSGEERLLLVREGELLLLGFSEIAVSWLQGIILLAMILFILLGAMRQNRQTRSSSDLVNCDKINKN